MLLNLQPSSVSCLRLSAMSPRPRQTTLPNRQPKPRALPPHRLKRSTPHNRSPACCKSTVCTRAGAWSCRSAGRRTPPPRAPIVGEEGEWSGGRWAGEQLRGGRFAMGQAVRRTAKLVTGSGTAQRRSSAKVGQPQNPAQRQGWATACRTPLPRTCRPNTRSSSVAAAGCASRTCYTAAGQQRRVDEHASKTQTIMQAREGGLGWHGWLRQQD